jgi:DNA modification methylase
MTVTLLPGDCLDVLRTLPTASVHCVVTSPPYFGLRAYNGGEQEIGSEATPDAYVAALVAVFREVWRVLRDDGSVWLNLGDSYASGEIGRHDSVQANNGRDWSGTRKGKTRMQTSLNTGLASKQLLGIPWRVAFALQADGWYLRSDIIWSKPNCMPESVKDRPTKAHEYVFLLTKQARYFYDADAVREESLDPASHRPWKTRNKMRMNDLDPVHAQTRGFHNIPNGKIYSRRNRRSVWHIATTPFSSRNLADYVGDDGKPYIASEDCPVHSHLRGSRIGHTGGYDGRGVSGGSGTSRSGAGLALEPARVSAPIQDHAGDGQGYDRAATSGAGPLLDALAAIDHSTQSHRMGHALETSPACTPSAQTPGRTDGTQGEHAFDGQDLSTGESNTSGHFALDANPLGQTPGRIDGSDRLSLMPPDPNGSTAKCTCQVLQDHFAVMPPKLVEPCVLAGTSERGVCPTCGAPWVRMVETSNGRHSDEYRARTDTPKSAASNGYGGRGSATSGLAKPGWRQFAPPTSHVLGWQPSCACGGEPVPAVVLDPFCGAGTVGLVARQHGRDFVGIDLNPRYLEIARRRIEKAAPVLPLLATGD